MDLRIPSGSVELAAHLAPPKVATASAPPGVVIAHGFPSWPGAAGDPGATHPELADRMGNEMGFVALAFSARGCGGSMGSFSPQGWLDDLVAAAHYLRDDAGAGSVWLVGFGTGGALAVCAAAQLDWVSGVATLGAPADFQDWAAHPRRLVRHAEEQGIVRSGGQVPSAERWAQELRQLSAADAAARLGDRPLLVLHGADDDLVPVFDARVLADAHGAAELRIIDGAGHQLRHDPRAVATLLGWLDRQRNSARAGV